MRSPETESTYVNLTVTSVLGLETSTASTQIHSKWKGSESNK